MTHLYEVPREGHMFPDSSDSGRWKAEWWLPEVEERGGRGGNVQWAQFQSEMVESSGDGWW